MGKTFKDNSYSKKTNKNNKFLREKKRFQFPKKG